LWILQFFRQSNLQATTVKEFYAEEKILQQNAFAYDEWSVSHFLRVTSPNVHRFLKLFHQQTQQYIRTKVITE